jgi:hypothetical protein
MVKRPGSLKSCEVQIVHIKKFLSKKGKPRDLLEQLMGPYYIDWDRTKEDHLRLQMEAHVKGLLREMIASSCQWTSLTYKRNFKGNTFKTCRDGNTDKLEFHHLHDKKFNVGRFRFAKCNIARAVVLKRYIKEAKKCKILCGYHHDLIK